MDSVGCAIKGRIDGTAVVRDKHGNIKGTFSFGGDATLGQMEEVAKANPSVPVDIKQTSGDDNGSDTSHGGA